MTAVVRKITKPQQRALDWLNNNGGFARFEPDGASVTANDHRYVANRETWVGLRDAGRITLNGSHIVVKEAAA